MEELENASGRRLYASGTSTGSISSSHARLGYLHACSLALKDAGSWGPNCQLQEYLQSFKQGLKPHAVVWMSDWNSHVAHSGGLAHAQACALQAHASPASSIYGRLCVGCSLTHLRQPRSSVAVPAGIPKLRRRTVMIGREGGPLTKQPSNVYVQLSKFRIYIGVFEA